MDIRNHLDAPHAPSPTDSVATTHSSRQQRHVLDLRHILPEVTDDAGADASTEILSTSARLGQNGEQSTHVSTPPAAPRDGSTAVHETAPAHASPALPSGVALRRSRTSPAEMTSGPQLKRDRAIIRAVMQLRVLSYAQIQHLFFGARHPSIASRRMRSLETAGWLQRWEERVARGGHPSYVLPSQDALLWARREILDETAPRPYAPLLATMLRDRSPRPLMLPPNTMPPYLAHQREINDVLIAVQRTQAAQTEWVSSWHRPFPNEAGQLALPQPDGVIVRAVNGRPCLHFLEHDRSSERASNFQVEKAQRYAAFARVSDLLTSLTGFEQFTVLVTVQCDAPLARIRALQAATLSAYGATMLFFTVHAWAIAAADQPIWFDAFTEPVGDALDYRAHAGLRLLPA